MAAPMLHVEQTEGRDFGGHIPNSHGHPPPPHFDLQEHHDFLTAQPGSRAPSERSTHFDVSDHDFLSARGPSRAPSQRSGMADTTQAARGAADRNRHAHRKLVLCFDGTGNKFHGDDSDSNILKIFRMLDRTASDQCECPSPTLTPMPDADRCGRPLLPA